MKHCSVSDVYSSVYDHLMKDCCLFFLKEGCRDFEDMDWYNSLIFFGASSQREVDPEDTDIKILLAVVEKIILPKLTCMFCLFCSIISYQVYLSHLKQSPSFLHVADIVAI